MLEIGQLYITRVGQQSRLCADITMNGKGTTLWFGVDVGQESYLCTERSDAFVMVLLPAAMRKGETICCQTPVSERLHYQLKQFLIPSLVSAGDLYHTAVIKAPLTAEPVSCSNAVGTGFSSGADSLYSIMTHGADSLYPLTHLAVFNVGAFEGAAFREGFRNFCKKAQNFAEELNLQTVFVDSNVQEVLPERFLDVYSFRNLAAALALQKLFSVYLLSSGHEVGKFHFDLHNSATFDFLTIHCANTESLTFYFSGGQVRRVDKLEALAQWPPAYRYLHPCFQASQSGKNCGHCKKCARDQTTLYALGVLERFSQVYDVPAYYRAMPQRIGFVLANRENHLYGEVAELLEKRQIVIPPAARVCEAQFRRALEHLREHPHD